MSEKLLKQLFYDLHTGYQSASKLYKKARELDSTIKYSDVLEFHKSQEINQINKKHKVTRQNFYKIVSPDLTFNLDHLFINKSLKGKKEPTTQSDYYIFLLAVDIGSRKAFIYHIPNKSQNETVKAFDKFIVQLNKDIHKLDGTPDEYARESPLKIYTDDAFTILKDRCKKLDIILDTQTAKDDHISKGNRLGIIDRLTRTIKNILMKYIYTHKRYTVPEVVSVIIENYNNTPHDGLNNITPNEAFENKHIRYENYKQGIEHNMNLASQSKFNIGDRVRVLDAFSLFEKEKPQFSKEIYTIKEYRGYKYKVEDKDGKQPRRLFKFHELQKVDKVDAPVEEENIENIKTSKKKIKTRRDLKREGISEENIIATRLRRH